MNASNGIRWEYGCQRAQQEIKTGKRRSYILHGWVPKIRIITWRGGLKIVEEWLLMDGFSAEKCAANRTSRKAAEEKILPPGSIQKESRGKAKQ